MKKVSSTRRVPRKIGNDEDDEATQSHTETAQSPDPVVRRPNAKPRQSSSLRKTLGPSAADEDEDSETSVVAPKRSNLSRLAIQRNASSRSQLLASQLPVRQVEDDDSRPSYSAEYLQELKQSTPSTPQNLQSASNTDIEAVFAGTRDLDIASKFGTALGSYGSSSGIPSATEIAEKKARRARLAKEEQADEYISLDVDDPDLDEDDNVMKDGHGRLVLKPKDKYGMAESRLVRDDEDIMENFDDFTEDGKIVLGRKAEAEASRKKRLEMAAQIADAEGGSDWDSDASEKGRNEAFEAAQTRHGTYGQNDDSKELQGGDRPKTPPIITPLPTLDGVIERLRKQLWEVQTSNMQRLKEMEALQREKVRLAEDDVRIQRLLKETAEKFDALRKEKGIAGGGQTAAEARPALGLQADGDGGASAAPEQHKERSDAEDEDMDDDDEVASCSGPAGLGFGSSRHGLGATVGLGMSTSAPSDSDDY